jgi:hypothetical protein
VMAKVEDAEFCLMLSITLAGVYPIEDHYCKLQEQFVN